MSRESSDDTFATTLTGIEELRSKHGSDDWPEWRRTVVEAVRAGAQLEKKVQQLELRIHGTAKAGAYSALAARVDALELLQSYRSKSMKWGTDLLKLILAGMFGFALNRIFR